ncbi:MAG TPA: hypothetical protein VNZ86_17685, partial [Bacteroidia bacterium]|nr:hypothetical protein [Bacteroidia bacterium]
GGRSFAFFSEDQHRNNSITDLLATYGAILFLVFFYHYYRSLRVLCESHNFSPGFAVSALVVILILGFSQSIFMKPFFYGILFIHYTCTNPMYKTSLRLSTPSLP